MNHAALSTICHSENIVSALPYLVEWILRFSSASELYRNRDIVWRRFGLDNAPVATTSELARKHGISRAWVSPIYHNESIKSMK